MENAAVVRCPKCRELMKQQDVSGHYGATLPLYQCPACLGIWVDRDVAFAMSRDSALEVEPDVGADDIATEPREVPIFCPRCEVYLNEQTGMNLPEGLHVDYCTTCHGFWFDKGELMIYKMYLEERRQERKEKMLEREAKQKEQRKRRERLKRTLNAPTPGSWSSAGIGYHPGLELARQLINLWRFLR